MDQLNAKDSIKKDQLFDISEPESRSVLRNISNGKMPNDHLLESIMHKFDFPSKENSKEAKLAEIKSYFQSIIDSQKT